MSENIKMSMEMELLIKGQDQLTHQIGRLAEQNSHLTEKITELISVEAARAERESNQEKKNQEFQDFIKANTDTLNRVRRWHNLVDGSMTKVFATGIIAGVIYFASVIATKQ